MPPELAFFFGIVTAVVIQGIYWRGFKRAHREAASLPTQSTYTPSETDVQIAHLRNRLAVLERITIDPADRTAREIDALRDAN